MTPLETLKRLAELRKDATPGPWTARDMGSHWNNPKIKNWDVVHGDNENIVDHVYEQSDSNLIAASGSTDFDALAAYVERLEGALGQISRMATMPDDKINTITLVAAHTVAQNALEQKP
jgi:hypothetical protein